MMKGWTLALALLLSACSGNSQKTYYQLPSTPDEVASVEKTATGQQLWLEHVSVADYLASSGLVYQTNDVQYVIASNNLWASPLDQQLQQSLVADLSRGMPGWLVTTQPQGGEQSVLNVSVTAFHGRYDGKVVIGGEWVLNHHGRVFKQPFHVVLPQSEDGYDALVRTLSQGWRQVAQSIARQVTAAD
ncbi:MULTISPECIES: membrane integrity-associated transporter subunit PqiC [unclassified Brenneria]|uniref:membrane integrity-associated transporter subunit PqiC n=1 Tax=unclassified Brenneria TaxID=2634434 RepID=UPI0029C352FE|nr:MULTISPECIES: membrane integrity-associated transporter subunit PqiC [unclassified Brenneria]MDX5626596.1 membrane integrity-associated transporter subunit PqiC [Brenneria sp. L3-3Z]MDX5694054.1 membrane integrity-associated transporter subunit PqiC [Brenneria sp. L4-2C]